VRQTQGNGIRVFPALNIEREQLAMGLATLKEAVEVVAGGGGSRVPSSP
jgi:4-aminobutyrate aminotransferase-like enzyme